MARCACGGGPCLVVGAAGGPRGEQARASSVPQSGSPTSRETRERGPNTLSKSPAHADADETDAGGWAVTTDHPAGCNRGGACLPSRRAGSGKAGNRAISRQGERSDANTRPRYAGHNPSRTQGERDRTGRAGLAGGNARPGAIGSSASDQPSAHPESRGTMVPGANPWRRRLHA